MPLLWISLCFLAGLALGELIPWRVSGWLTLAGACLAAWPLFLLLSQKTRLRLICWPASVEPQLHVPPLLLLACVFLGAARITASGPDLNSGHIAAWNDQGKASIQAVISAPPDAREATTLLRLDVEAVNGQPAHGTVLGRLRAAENWDYGDRLLLEGEPVSPPQDEEFDYRAYLARQDIYTYLTYPRIVSGEQRTGNPLLAALYGLRARALEEINRLFPAPEAPLLAGILLGVESGIPPDLDRAFQDTGTAHVIAISGFNIAILAALFSRLFGSFLTRWWAMLAAILAVVLYTLLVGAAPSVVRAAIMGSLALVAEQIGRRSTGINSLGLAAALMCLGNPHLPWDTSFQLSFLATLGLILYGDRLQNWLTGFLQRRVSAAAAQSLARPLCEYVLLTLAAQWMTLPVILSTFRRLSVSGLLANPLVLPVQPAVMVLSGLAVMVGMVFEPLGRLFALIAWPFPAYTIRVVEHIAALPGGVLATGKLSPAAIILACAAALAPALKLRIPRLGKQILAPSVLFSGLFILAALGMRAGLARPDNRLHLLVMDQDGTQALLVRGPGGGTILINGGPSGGLLADSLGRWLSPFDRRLDALVIDSCAVDGLAGLPGLLERYPTGQALWGCEPGNTRTVEDLLGTTANLAISNYAVKTGEAIDFGEEVRLEVLSTSEEGSALLLHWNNFRALLPAGLAPGKIQSESLANLSVLLVDERDLARKTEWLQLTPQVVVYTPGEASLPVEGINWINTHKGGWVHLTTDGERMWMEQK